MPEVTKEDSCVLPEGWIWKKLREVCDEINPPKSEIQELQDETEVTFVPMKAVSEEGKIIDPEIKSLGEVRVGYTYFKEGDVLFAKITPCMENGKTAIAKKLINGIGFGSTEFHVLRTSQEIIPEFIHYYIRQKSFRKDAARNMMGTAGQKRVPRDFMENKEIPLPSLKEQHRIVARIGEFMSKIEKARRLKRIAKQRSKKVLQAALHKLFSKAEEKGWKWEKLGNIAEISGGFGFSKKFQGKEGLEYPFIKVNDMNLPGNEIYVTKAENTADRELLNRIKAKTYPVGTIIFPKIGGAIATNKKRILAKEATFDNNVMGVVPGQSLNSEWLYYFLRTINLMDLAKTTALPSIRKSAVAELRIPIPSLEEQKEMVAYLGNVRRSIKSLKILQRKTSEDIENLVHAILDKAFKGKLH